MICKKCGKNPLYEYSEYSLAEYITYLRRKFKEEWEASQCAYTELSDNSCNSPRFKSIIARHSIR